MFDLFNHFSVTEKDLLDRMVNEVLKRNKSTKFLNNNTLRPALLFCIKYFVVVRPNVSMTFGTSSFYVVVLLF